MHNNTIMTEPKSFEQPRSKLRANPESRILGEQYECAIQDALALGKLRESCNDVQEGVAGSPRELARRYGARGTPG